jgi:hypothetical protein
MTSNFPKEAFLLYLPNNFQIWYKTLVQTAAHEYGALATALDDESLINFDYAVPKLSANAIAGIFDLCGWEKTQLLPS